MLDLVRLTVCSTYYVPYSTYLVYCSTTHELMILLVGSKAKSLKSDLEWTLSDL